MPKRTKITLATESLLILRGRRPLRGWCPECGSEVEIIPPEAMGVVSNSGAPELKAWIEPGPHRSQETEGAPLICLNSILKRVCKATKSQGVKREQH